MRRSSPRRAERSGRRRTGCAGAPRAAARARSTSPMRMARTIAQALEHEHPATCWRSCRAQARSAACSSCSKRQASARRARAAAVRRAVRRRAGRSAAARPTGAPQDRARHQHRRDQPHDRRRAHRRRLRARAPRALRSGERHEPPGDRARSRARRPNSARARGTLGPGVCYRLWREERARFAGRATAPEILEADLAPLALDLAAWGIADPRALRWLDPPPAATFAQARDLLRSLDALDARGRDHGARPRDGATRRRIRGSRT